MRTRLIAACLGFLALGGLASADRGGSGGQGGNQAPTSWVSGRDPGTVVTIGQLNLNRPGKCLGGTAVVCSPGGAITIILNTAAPLICQPALASRCLGGAAFVAPIGIALWCRQRG